MLFAENFGESHTLNQSGGRIGKLHRALQSRGLVVEVVNEVEGPASRTYEIRLGVGTRVSELRRGLEDLAIDLQVHSIHLSYLDNVLRLEVPRQDRTYPKTREVYSEISKDTLSRGDFIVGVNSAGEVVKSNLSSLPHMIIAGATGAGKSVAIHHILTGLMYTHSPKDLRLALVDPKRLELPMYQGLPHLGSEVVTEPRDAQRLLSELSLIMEKRYRRLSTLGLNSAHQVGSGMPLILLVIDEFADFRATIGKSFEKEVLKLAQKSRAAGIHMMLATQRPSAKVITGDIKANFPARMALKASSAVDSRVILGEAGAEKLLGAGDALFSHNSRIERVQVPYADRNDVDFLKRHYDKVQT